MSLIDDVKKIAIARLKQRRHRQIIDLLDSLPEKDKLDIGWVGPNRRYS